MYLDKSNHYNEFIDFHLKCVIEFLRSVANFYRSCKIKIVNHKNNNKI